MSSRETARILCVDDEPNVLEGLKLNLGRRFTVVTRLDGASALEAVQTEGGFAAVISDMRMPGMNGAVLLSQIRRLSPDTTRVLLTGQADLESAVAAVNEGQIFRFLMKPCPPAALIVAVVGAVEQHRLLTSERVLLEQTLHGSIQALVEVMALTHPRPFGRAMRLRQLVGELTQKLGWQETWHVEVAALLSQLGAVALPHETSEKHFQGEPLSPDEEAMVARMPTVTEQLLAHIPRLDVVRGILAAHASGGTAAVTPGLPKEAMGEPQKALVSSGAQLLRLAHDFDVLHTANPDVALALGTLRARAEAHDLTLLEALADLRTGSAPELEVQRLPLASLQVGMVLAEDLRTTADVLLATRGYLIGEGFLQKARNFSKGSVQEPVSVLVPKEQARQS